MPEDIRISVVVPAFNAANSVIAAVKSCLNQTSAPFEVIVVDDGSNDDTVESLRNHFGNSIKLIQQKKNQGPSAARNRGVEAASGTHIAFQDADDLWHPQKIEFVKEVLAASPGIQFLFHRFTLDPMKSSIPRNSISAKKYPFWKILLRNPVATPCTIIRKDSIEPFNEAMQHTEDYELFLRLAQKHGLHLLDASLTQLGRPVLSKGGQSANKLKMRLGELKAWRSLCNQAPQYYFLLPFLTVFAALKHVGKSLSRVFNQGK